jgi:hypothetical protein
MAVNTNQIRKRSVPKTIGPSTPIGRLYKGFRLEDVVYRVGALDMLVHPSRYGNNLIYPTALHQESSNG